MINKKRISYKSKDEPNNVLIRTLLRTSQYENENVMRILLVEELLKHQGN
jgi:hypothetical protein